MIATGGQISIPIDQTYFLLPKALNRAIGVAMAIAIIMQLVMHSARSTLWVTVESTERKKHKPVAASVGNPTQSHR